MNINAKLHPITEFDKEASRQGVGANALWNGPLDTTAYPKGKGSSSGIKGIILNNDKPEYNPMPITQKAKGRF
jgi:hypothetical protein